MNLTHPQHNSYYNQQMQHIHQGTQTTVTIPKVPSSWSMPMRLASTLNSTKFENTEPLNYTSFPLPIVNAAGNTNEDQRRNILLRTVNYKTTKMLLVEEVKDVNPP